MDLEFSEEHHKLRQELRTYFATLVPVEARSTGHGERSNPEDRAIMRRLGRDGWLGMGYPTEYGGQGRSLIETAIFYDEALRAGVPVSHVTLLTVGPALLRWGTPEQKQTLIPRILAGEAVFSIGYTEPGAGTDLASLTTRAERDGDQYVINGQKVFTSGGDCADFIWLAARTDPASRGSRGISLFIIPTTTPGFAHSPIPTLSTHITTSTYYEDVRVDKSALVGEEGQGWKVITDQLSLERVTLVMPGPLQQLYEDVLEWAREATTSDGRRVADQAWVRCDLARVRCILATLHLMTWRAITAADGTAIDAGDASVVKVYGSEGFVECSRLLLGITGRAGAIKRGSAAAPLHGRVEAAYRAAAIKTFGGGVNEVQREIIGRWCLGLPNVPRRLERVAGQR
jgi:alkylation response protein AidB-like acyl-CoA dehydrogenase